MDTTNLPDIVSVVSYNLLSDALCNPKMYLNATEDDEICDPKKRLSLIMNHLNGLDEQFIICLQEVSENWSCQLFKYFYDKNYTYIASNYGNHWNGYMGVAIAFHKDVYKMDMCDIKRIGDLVPPESNKAESWVHLTCTTLGNAIQKTSQFLCGQKFKCLEPYLEKTFQQLSARRNNTLITLRLCGRRGNSFVVANYHMPCVFWNTKVMITHALLALGRAVQMTNIYDCDDELPLIFVGDFNSQPDQTVYNIISNGGWHALDPSWENDPDLRYLKHLTVTDCAGILKSAYRKINGREPEYTNKVLTKQNPFGFEATLDYIFYLGRNIDSISVIPVDCSDGQVLPNLEQPSDHLMIGSTFQIFNYPIF